MLREPRGYPAANCNLLLPSWHPEADAGYVIMEQVEYPGMSGTNTMCVVTVLLETGMLPMTEPVTELTLEAPAGLIRVRAECRDGKVTAVTFRNVPAFATHIAAPVEVPHLGTVTVDVAYGGMFYVIADAAAFGLRLTPGRGRRHRAHHRDDQGGRERATPRRPPGPAGLRGDHHRAAVRPRARPGEQPSQRGDGVDRDARLGAARDVDRRHRPLAVRDRDVGQDGDAPRARASWPSATSSATKGSSARSSPGGSRRRRRSGSTGRSSRRSPGQAWITGFASYVVDPTDPFPDGFTVGDIW